MRTRTKKLAIQRNNQWVIEKEITCYVYGEMCDRRKVWVEVDGDEDNQYYLIKVGKEFYFIES